MDRGTLLSAGERRLVLFLSSHVCLEADVLRWLAIHECYAPLVLSRGVRRALSTIAYVHCRGVREAVELGVRYPAFPGLFRPSSDRHAPGLFKHQVQSLAAMRAAEHGTEAYGALRGGILADAPGLGKSVTVLAHILASAGEMPKAACEFWDAGAVAESWRSLSRTSAGRLSLWPDVNKGVRALVAYRDRCRRSDEWSAVNAVVEAAKDLSRFETPDSLELYVRTSLARLRVTPGERASIAGDLHQAVAIAKARLDRRNRAALLQRGAGAAKRLLAERLAIPSGATLVVVPDPLLSHWRTMIGEHWWRPQLAPSFGDGLGSGIAWVEGFGDAAKWPDGPAGLPQRGRLPSAADLRKYLVVVVSFSFCDEAARAECSRKSADALKYTTFGNASTSNVSSLLQVRWLRLVVDEGHDLGAERAAHMTSLADNARQQAELQGGELSEQGSALLCEIFAERRWVCSGTPTTGDVDDSATTRLHLKQLSNLLRWLRHPIYGIDKDPRLDTFEDLAAARDACQSRWESHIAAPFLTGSAADALGTRRMTWSSPGRRKKKRRRPDDTDSPIDAATAVVVEQPQRAPLSGEVFELARGRLVDLLRGMFVRHRKEDLDLPKPIFVNSELEVAPQLPTERDDDFQWRVDETIGDHVVSRLREAEKSQDGVVPKMVVFSQCNADLQSVAEVLYSRLGESRIAEFAVHSLGHAVAARELARFANGVRLVRRCPVCGGDNDADAQRGCHRTLMEVELLDSATVTRRQAVLDDYPELRAGPKSARRVLVEPERIVRVVHSRSSTDWGAYANDFRAWRVDDQLVVDLGPGPPRPSFEAWCAWGGNRCEALAAEYNYEARHWYFAPLLAPRRHQPRDDPPAVRAVVRLKKWGRCSAFHNASWFRGPALTTAPIHTVRESVPLLCLYKDASHGIDLSFATRILLLEPVRDSALLEQVVSRAYRVGATQPVVVETLYTFIGDSAAAPPATASTPRANRANGGTPTRERHTSLPTSVPNKNYICDFCFKSFLTNGLADRHMLACSRNPNNMAEARAARHTIASVFDELRPPSCTTPAPPP